MKFVFRFIHLLITFSICGKTALAFQASTPEGALEEMVTTDKFEVVIRHFPVQLEEAIAKLDEKEKGEVSRKLVPHKQMELEGVKLRKLDDGTGWELAEIKDEKKTRVATIKIKNTFASNDEALVMAEFTQEKAELTQEKEERKEQEKNEETPNNNSTAAPEKVSIIMLFSMRLQQGEWRILGFGPWHEESLESETFLAGLLHKNTSHHGVSAASTLRTLLTVLILYQNTYPQVGFPSTLQQLAGPEGAEASAEHALMVDSSFMATPLIKEGYLFQYTLIDPGAQGHDGRFRITATPVDLSQPNAKSYYVDQEGVIRSTTDRREANENDPADDPQ